MEETSEDKMLREIDKLKEQVKSLSETHKEDRESMIKNVLKRASLYTRFKIFLEMQYLTLTIQPDRPATDEEFKQAHIWADQTTTHLIGSLLRWEEDGRPALYPNNK